VKKILIILFIINAGCISIDADRPAGLAIYLDLALIKFPEKKQKTQKEVKKNDRDDTKPDGVRADNDGDSVRSKFDIGISDKETSN